jgi:hypothetical protein
MAAASKEASISRQLNRWTHFFPDKIIYFFASMASPEPIQLGPEDECDYKALFSAGWCFHPNIERLMVPRDFDFRRHTIFTKGFDPGPYQLAIYCQVSGKRFRPDDGPIIVKKNGNSEVLRVNKAGYEWLLEQGWEDVRKK